MHETLRYIVMESEPYEGMSPPDVPGNAYPGSDEAPLPSYATRAEAEAAAGSLGDYFEILAVRV